MSDVSRTKTPAAITTECSLIVEQHLNVEFYRKSRAKFLSTCDDYALMMLVSKDHGNKFWFSIWENQIEWFENQNIPNQYFTLACGGSDLMFLFPAALFQSWKEELNSRIYPKNGRKYWHINIKQISGVWKLQTKKEFDDIFLEEFQIGEKVPKRPEQNTKTNNKQGSGEVEILKPLIIEALKSFGGMAKMIDISKYIHDNHQNLLEASGDLLYRWHYVLRWSGTSLRHDGVLLPASECKRGYWGLC